MMRTFLLLAAALALAGCAENPAHDSSTPTGDEGKGSGGDDPATEATPPFVTDTSEMCPPAEEECQDPHTSVPG